jgi:hypothetical protein
MLIVVSLQEINIFMYYVSETTKLINAQSFGTVSKNVQKLPSQGRLDGHGM